LPRTSFQSMMSTKNTQINYSELKGLKISPLSNKLSIVIITIVTLLLYANTFTHEFAYDDASVISSNSYVQEGVGGIKKILTQGSWDGFKPAENMKIYRPFQLLVFAVQYEFFKLNPTPYHIINVLFYALLNCLLFLLLKQFWNNKYPYLPLLIVLLFATHPVHVEVAANLKGSADLFGMLHATAAFLFLFYYIHKKKVYYIVFACFFYLLSLASKEIAVTYIGVFPLAMYFFTELKLKSIIKNTTPFILVIGLYLLIRFLVFDGNSSSSLTHVDDFDNVLLLAETSSQEIGMRLWSLGKNLQLLIFPDPLRMMYVYDDIPFTEVYDFIAISTFLVYLLLTFVSIFYFRKKSILVFGIVFYLLTISLFSNTYAFMPNILAERWLLIPSFGFCIVLGVLLYRALVSVSTLSNFIKSNILIVPIISIILFLYSFKTFDRNYDWKNDATIFAADIKTCPNNQIVLRGHGTELMRSSEPEKIKEGIIYLEKARKQLPTRYGTNNNIGIAYLKLKDFDKAAVAFERELQLAPKNKTTISQLWGSYNKAGIELMDSNDPKKIKESLFYFIKAQKLVPTNYQAIHNLGKAYYMLRDMDSAIATYESIFQAVPQKHDSAFALGLVYNTAKKHEEALGVLLTLKDIEGYNDTPNFRKQLYMAYTGLGQFEAAAKYAAK
jgi:tetratricopeptide (TPR) repeat protein